MKTKSNISSTYKIYDLSNPHLQNAEIITHENVKIKGQFVKFKVVENIIGFKIYPSEKFCFLPTEHQKEFWNTFKMNRGVFNELPEYIKLFGLNELKKIIIHPSVIG
ncbi:MAG: hypothetical protein HYU68_02055 [Bacteroidetes bacterium]|nr:hypothetical protein [Bacteroidota bacterium]